MWLHLGIIPIDLDQIRNNHFHCSRPRVWWMRPPQYRSGKMVFFHGRAATAEWREKEPLLFSFLSSPGPKANGRDEIVSAVCKSTYAESLNWPRQVRRKSFLSWSTHCWTFSLFSAGGLFVWRRKCFCRGAFAITNEHCSWFTRASSRYKSMVPACIFIRASFSSAETNRSSPFVHLQIILCLTFTIK